MFKIATRIFSNICNLRDLNFPDIEGYPDIEYPIYRTVLFIFETREQFFSQIHGGASDFNLLTT